MKAFKEVPSMDQWMEEAKKQKEAQKIGMYLFHNGVVRQTAKAQVRGGDSHADPVTGMLFSYDPELVERAVCDTYQMEGIFYIRVWLNQGRLQVGDDIMRVLIGGDIRPHVVAGLEYLVERIKKECVIEKELTESEKF